MEDQNKIDFNKSIFVKTRALVDVKTYVGPGHIFENMDELMVHKDVLIDSMIVHDANYSVSWKVIKSGETWLYELYDGQFHVRCVLTFGDALPLSGLLIQGLTTADGISCAENDVILVVNTHPNLNGIWIVHESIPWTRHPIFDEAIDNLRAITIIADNGTIYKNAQWQLTTIGDITPATLNSDYSDFVNDIDLFESYTWLHFEILGRGYPLLSLTSGTSQIGPHSIITKSDTTSGDVIIERTHWHHIPNLEYKILKTDPSANRVIYKVPYTSYDFHVLLEEGDWFTITNPTNNNTDPSEYIVFTNRINKLIIPTAVSADGKLDIDVPTGYRLWQIRGYVSSAGTADTILDIGKTSGTDNIAAAVGYTDDGAMVVLDVDDNTITEVWISDYGNLGWNGNSVTFQLHVIKE